MAPSITTSCAAAGQTYAAASTYAGCDTADKIICTGPATGQVWAMCNVGASTTANYNSTSTSRSSLASVDGKLFQFARNDPFDAYTTIALANIGGSVMVSPDVFTAPNPNYWHYSAGDGDWRAPQLSTANAPSVNIWTDSPCGTNYHIPTQTEFQAAYNVFPGQTYGATNNFPTVLKMSFIGHRNGSDGSLVNRGVYGYYWSSSPSSAGGYHIEFGSSAVYLAAYPNRSAGFSIRCIRN